MRDYAGRAVDGLNLEERLELAGKWIALELYSPSTLPLRIIAAVGDSARACIEALKAKNLDPAKFEYLPMRSPYPN